MSGLDYQHVLTYGLGFLRFVQETIQLGFGEGCIHAFG
jgi:hypothetical protein